MRIGGSGEGASRTEGQLEASIPFSHTDGLLEHPILDSAARRIMPQAVASDTASEKESAQSKSYSHTQRQTAHGIWVPMRDLVGLVVD